MPQIFLNYRRQDSDHALSIYLWLIRRYGRESLFWDRKNIDPGRPFAEVIEEGIQGSKVFIALIGPGWVTIADSEGRRKLYAPDDWVRLELRAALDSGVLVLPVLGSGAVMPAAADLPEDIRRLSGLQALTITDMRFHALLAEQLEQAGIRAPGPAGQGEETSRFALRAGELLRRQAGRLQVRSKELIGEGKSDRAMEELNEGIELIMALLDFVPGEQMLDLELGYVYAALGRQLEDAGDHQRADRYLNLALGIFQRATDEALRKLDQEPASILEVSGEIASAIKGVGEIYYNRGDMDTAISYYQQALKIEPTYQYAWHDLFGAYDGLARRGRIDIDGMRLALKKTRETSAGSDPGTQVPGLSEAYLKSLEKALLYWEQQAAAYPHLVTGAEERYSAAITAQPDDPEPYVQRARSRVARGDRTGGLEDYSAAIARGRQDAGVYSERGGLEFAAGEYGAAEADFTAAIERGAAQSALFHYRGQCRSQLGNFAGAESDFTVAVQQGHTDSLPLRGAVRMALADYEGAESDLSEAIAQKPETAALYQVRAMVRKRRDDHAGAASDLSMAITKGTDGDEVYKELGDESLASEDYEGAIAAYTKSLERQEASGVYAARGMAKGIQGDAAGAVADLQTAVDQGVANPFFLYLLGKMRMLLDDAVPAEEALTGAIAKGYQDNTVYYWRGRARFARHDYAGAEKDFAESIQRGRDDEDTKQRREQAAALSQSNRAGA